MYTEHGSNSQAEASSYFPELPDYDGGVSGHLETLRRASEALDIPVIASLNGTTAEGWIEHARASRAGRAPRRSSSTSTRSRSIPRSSGAEVERRYVDIVREVAASVRDSRSPIKLPPYFSSLPHMAAELVRAGADGLVLFNRFYAPDIDLDDAARDAIAAVVHRRRAAALARLDRACCPAASRARSRPAAASRRDVEVVKYLLVGADVVMTASALLRHGPEHIGDHARRDSNAGSARTASTRSTRSAA